MNLNMLKNYLENTNTARDWKVFIYFIHNPRTGGKYIKDIAFNECSYYPNGFTFQWYGKLSNAMLGTKSDDHPCAMENPVTFHETIRNQSETFIYDQYFLDPRSLVLFTVRNPYDRYVAAYIDAKNNYEKYEKYCFKKFLIEVCDSDFKPNPEYAFSFDISRQFFPYQIFTDCGYPIADIVLRKELLNQGLRKVLAMFGMSPVDQDDKDHKYKLDNMPKQWNKRRLETSVALDKNYSDNRDYRLFYEDNESIDIISEIRKNELIAFSYDFENNHDGTDLIDPSNIRYSHKENTVRFEND